MQGKSINFKKPVDILAFLMDEFSLCGCNDFEESIKSIKSFLEWLKANSHERPKFDELYKTQGEFYLIAGIFDRLQFSEHGTSGRHPWITETGKEFLEALNAFSVEEIESATGKAYNGWEF